MDYVQPDFYRFNEDSLKLVEVVASNFNGTTRVLDIGAGCGVIGIELAQRVRIDDLHLLELQNEFKPYLEENISRFIPEQKHSIVISPLSQYPSTFKYDLIVCNPPYYLPGKGEPNKNVNRGICRSFQVDSWNDLLNLFERSLTSTGSAWVVIKNDKLLLQVIDGLKTSLLSSKTILDKVAIIKFYRAV